MTVCAAAICQTDGDEGRIVIAADRMLTAGDVQFEPQQSKIAILPNFKVVLVAGNAPLQTEILKDLIAEMRSNPEEWSVRDIAERYQHHYNLCLMARSANSILAPFGLEHDSFIAKQKDMAPEFLSHLLSGLLDFQMPGTQAIFAGLDEDGPHIYVANRSDITCQDAVGFAAIGAGRRHAESQFMFAGHTREKRLAETLWLVHAAKKRAEVAPGVGRATDMRVLGPKSLVNGLDRYMANLQRIYEEAKAKEGLVNLDAAESVRRMLEEG